MNGKELIKSVLTSYPLITALLSQARRKQNLIINTMKKSFFTNFVRVPTTFYGYAQES